MSARGGAAAHSMRRLLCCSMDGNNEEESSFCLPSAVAPMSWTYHILFLAAAIPLSPPPRSLPPSDTIRALAVGLGGGELLTSLLAFFPQMDVTAVDISAETVNLSLRYFHMHDAICSVHLLDSDDNGTLLRPHDAFQQHIDDRREQSMVHLKSPTSSCRSHLILADVWKLLDHYVTPRSGEQHDSKVTFHYIFFDVFDAVAGTWGGSSYEGVSNVVPPNIRHSLQSIYQLLDEQYGLALFHLHKDGNFMGYWREIQEVFGRSRTALLELAGGNAVVAVSKAAFYVNSHAYDNILAKLQSEHCDQHGVEGQECSWRVDDVEYWEAVDSAHPCDFPVAAVRREFAFAEAMGYPDDWRWMGSYALNCTNHNQF